MEADKAEEEIIQAQARAKAEEERVLNLMKADAGEDFHKMGLPPGEDSGMLPPRTWLWYLETSFEWSLHEESNLEGFCAEVQVE